MLCQKGARGALFQGWTGIETLFFEECSGNSIADEFHYGVGLRIVYKGMKKPGDVG
jgi:hypothetical protein